MKSIITIYHGSDHIVGLPAFGGGKLNNDYGRGFYCTEDIDLAKEWACSQDSDGYVNEYLFDTTGLSVLFLNGAKYSILNWLAVLAKYRTYWQNNGISELAKQYLHENFFVDVSDYDVIVGYRADDSYFSFAQDFVSNSISLNQLSQAMRLGKLGEQIVLKSEKAFKQIGEVQSHMVLSNIYYGKKVARDREARREYRSVKSVSLQDIYMLDIIREEIKHGDPRISGL